MIPIYDFSSFENACKSSAQRSLLTCQLVTYLKQPIIFGYNNRRKNVKCLFVVIFNDYVKAFKKSASYIIYLNGGRCGKGLGRDELKL